MYSGICVYIITYNSITYMKKPRIAITNNSQVMRCRLIMELIDICGGEPVPIPMYLKPSEVGEADNADPDEITLPQDIIEKAKKKRLQLIRKQLDRCDGILIPGNPRDVPPSAYNADFIHPQTQRRLPESNLNIRFDVESLMMKYAIHTRPLPILGICGGFQVANVILGGNLVQHLPEDKRIKKGKVKHRDPNLKILGKKKQKDWEKHYREHILYGHPDNIFTATHPMNISPNSQLADVYREVSPDVDLTSVSELSIHHQGCFSENMAKGLVATAIAPDGVIEAMEMPSHPHLFILTQFHWECNVSGIAKTMVSRLVKDASKLM